MREEWVSLRFRVGEEECRAKGCVQRSESERRNKLSE